MSNDTVTLTLSRNYAGQIIDGLQCREDAYRKTAEYLETGIVQDLSFVCEEVSDADEARSLADLYAEIIHEINQQMQGR